MSKKRIAWITATCFLDTDIYIAPLMQKYYDVDWFILRKENEKIDYENELEKLKSTIDFSFVPIGRRNSSPDALTCYFRFLKKIHKEKYDLIYTAMGNMPFYTPMLGLTQRADKVVLGIHNVHVLNGGCHPRLERFYNWFAITRFKNFHTYSKGQYEELKKIAPNKNILYAPFQLKDYGTAKHKRQDDRITFLGYGNIRRYKRLDVLISAAEKVYAETGIKFRVIIAGACEDWENYQKLIQHEELFDLRIKRIPNEEIPELFEEVDYVVMPYQDIAQSGALMVAMNYEKPVLASRLHAFKEYIHDGENGLFFKPADVNELSEKMQYVLMNHAEVYPKLQGSFRDLKQQEYSSEVIVNKYRMFFDDLMNKNRR